MSNAKDVTTDQFEELKKTDGIYLIDFWAGWCAPCKMMAPIIDELSKDEDLKDVNFIKIDVDQEAALSGSFGVRSIPTFLLIKFKGDGTFSPEEDVKAKFIGALGAFDFKMKLLDELAKI
jgi:thioredoxin 1